ncbi:hypothetical protein Lal_00000527 [Lupinus albus]|nr:hypothetical protein Lal_00000527 [Lupinus albus]
MQQGGGSETEVTWEDQQNINKFGRLNNRLHELEDEIKFAKEDYSHGVVLEQGGSGDGGDEEVKLGEMVKESGVSDSHEEEMLEISKPVFHDNVASARGGAWIKETNDNLEDASNELIITDEEVVRFQIGEVFAHVPKDEVEDRIEQMKEVTSQKLEKLEEEKESVLAQMSELKKILYGKFKDSINLEED